MQGRYLFRIKPLFLIICVTVSLFGYSQFAYSQYSWDIGARTGFANYLGEIGGKEKDRRNGIADMKIGQSRWAIGSFARYRLPGLNALAFNMGFSYLRIQGADKFSTNLGRRGRNLSFVNDMFESYFRAEVLFYYNDDFGGRSRYSNDFAAYGFVGVAGLLHGPRAKLDGKWHSLRPLKTEGQKDEYAKFIFSVPYGIGAFTTFVRAHRIGVEINARMVFTDYLDDISTEYTDPLNLKNDVAVRLANRTQEAIDEDPSLPSLENYIPGRKRGDNTHTDAYGTLTFTYSYLIRGKSNFYRKKYGWIGIRKRKGRRKRSKF